MNFKNGLIAALTGTAITTSIVITRPLISVAFDGQELSTTTREITVLINSSNGSNGSGVIISKKGNTYYVLTANHVTSKRGDKNGDIEYTVIAHDKKPYPIDPDTIKPVANDLDMAIFEFQSVREYPVATISSSELVETTPVFVSGWQRPGTVNSTTVTRQITSSRITTILEEDVHGGYQIGYDNTTLGGMSGGPVVDAEGRLVGVHGLADSDTPETIGFENDSADARTISELLKTGFNYGIPIRTFLSEAAQSGIYLNLDVENSPPEELTDTPVIETDPEKDQIDDINSVLDDVERVRDVIERFPDVIPRLPSGL
ncbi:trypsin-like serine protease with C-terminal PDZ domain [Xenococcus sp. PCC 7305]|uniref:S1 family peptidase n=1 Tax=Xenococcus sp. PCC 7305 TaxID=102125 RepID=UPI0002AC93D1|nr:serine protease [Xenococcus sp. PCC 7305]ELS01234.1 trypsin-like serine protease with C-terminal PDZ domain [Xenococcus sp. PCC 7305]